jgi:hypothetical protein
MKRILLKVIAAAFFTVFTGSCGCVRAQQIKMTIKYGYEREVKIRIGGATSVKIDWGDGETETKQYDPKSLRDKDGDPILYDCKHKYSNTAAHTVTVTGRNITHFNCSYIPLTNLDVSKNTALTVLWCVGNGLKYLNVSQNTALTGLCCTYNELTGLDLSKNTALIEFECFNNRLKGLDVSNNTALTGLWCFENELTWLNVGNNTALTALNCKYNRLKWLDVSKNPALTHLVCEGNELKGLEVSKNPVLISLNLDGNQLSASALNALFKTLHKNTLEYQKQADVSNNPGTKACNWKIAEDRGWEVFYHSDI